MRYNRKKVLSVLLAGNLSVLFMLSGCAKRATEDYVAYAAQSDTVKNEETQKIVEAVEKYIPISVETIEESTEIIEYRTEEETSLQTESETEQDVVQPSEEVEPTSAAQSVETYSEAATQPVTSQSEESEEIQIENETTAYRAIQGITEGVVLTDEQAMAAANENSSAYASYVNEIVNLTNEYRANNGKSQLTYDGTLTLMAMFRSAEGAHMNHFSHTRPNGGGLASVATLYGVYGTIGENLGRYQTSASQVVNEWIASDSHRAIMLDDRFTRMGVGVAVSSDGSYYWTQIFCN